MAKVIKISGGSSKSKTKKPRVTVASIRENRGKDNSPNWDGAENWTALQFTDKWHNATRYYTLEFNVKEHKGAVVKWMNQNGIEKSIIDAFKKTDDWRCNSTMGTIASCLLKGMPAHHENFNHDLNVHDWLLNRIESVIDDGKSDHVDEEDVPKAKTPNIQDRVRETALSMTDEIEEEIDVWMSSPDTFDPKKFKVLHMLKGKDAKASHARIIKDVYSSCLSELTELTSKEVDEDLKEGYSGKTKKHIAKLLAFYKEIDAACDMLIEEGKVLRKPRVKKAIPKEKVVEKLKYLKSYEPLKLVSVNPIDIIGMNELWTYNTTTRKIGRYVSDSLNGPLGIKGTTIIGFDENKSIQKTIRKPDVKLKEFKSAGKVALKKFLDDIVATDTKMTGRINEDIILLKIL